MNPSLIHRVASLYRVYENILFSCRDILLLAIRLVWGIQLMQTGWGKFHNLAKVTGFFTDLGIPFPGLNAPFVAGVETFCGLFLAVGLFGRLTPLPIIATLVVAYATSEQEALKALISGNPDPFFAAAPFLFLFAAIIIWVFGPGRISLDALVGKLTGQKLFSTSGE